MRPPAPPWALALALGCRGPEPSPPAPHTGSPPESGLLPAADHTGASPGLLPPPEGERCTAAVGVDLGDDGAADREGVDRFDPARPDLLLRSERGPVGGPPDRVEVVERDAAGRELRRTWYLDGDGAVDRSESRTWDEAGRELRFEADDDGDGAADRWIERTWSGGLEVARREDTDGDGATDRWSTLAYDAAGRLTELLGWADEALTVPAYAELRTYDAAAGSSGVIVVDEDGRLPASARTVARFDASDRPVSSVTSVGAPRFARRASAEDWTWDASTGALLERLSRTWDVPAGEAGASGELDLYVEQRLTPDAAGRPVEVRVELGSFLEIGPVLELTVLQVDRTLTTFAPCP